MDNQQIKNFIETSRKAGVKDDKIMSFLQNKGVNLTQPAQPKPEQDMLSKSSSIVNSIFPGGKIGEAFGTDKVKNDVMKGFEGEFDYSKLSPEATARLQAKGVPTTAEGQRTETAGTVTGPTGLQVAGDVAQVASFFLPYARMASSISKVAPIIGKTGANVATGLAGGYLADVGINLSQGERGKEALSPGLGTAIGGALPLVGPLARGGKYLATEALGTSTGVGSTTLREFGNAVKAGGPQADEAVRALRGNTTPEQIVTTAKDSLGEIYSKRTAEYVKSLETLQGVKQSLDVSPIVKELDTQLGKFNIKVTPEGGLDFTRSPLRFNKQAQNEIETIFNEMKGFGLQEGDRTVIGVDSLKRAFRDLFSDSSEARAFIQSMKKSAESVANTVDGYKAMTSKYADDTDLITEITKGLSLGDKVSTDTAFRKLTTALRTNNEFRKQLVDELNAVSGGKLIPQIAGQQLSETLPRGMIRPLAGVAGGAGLLTGIGILPMLQALVLTSPRAVGEIINALGVTAKVGNNIKKFLIPAGAKFPGDMILDKASKTPNKQGGFAKIPGVANNQIIKDLESFDALPVKTNKGFAYGDTDANFRLSQLKDKMQTKSLTKAELSEAESLLKQVGGSSETSVMLRDDAVGMIDDIIRQPTSEDLKNFSDIVNKYGKTEAYKIFREGLVSDTIRPNEAKKIFDGLLEKIGSSDVPKVNNSAKALNDRLATVVNSRNSSGVASVTDGGSTYRVAYANGENPLLLNKEFAKEKMGITSLAEFKKSIGLKVKGETPPTNLDGTKKLKWDTIPEGGTKVMIPLDKIRVTSNALEKATNNVKIGNGSRTSGPVDIAMLKDGTFAIEEGHHRIVQRMLQGDKNIEALVHSTKHSASPDSIYNKLDTTFIKKSTPTNLISEAKKYKSAEEFVKARGNQVYHGTSMGNAEKINKEGFKVGSGQGVSGQNSKDFIYATDSKVSAGKYVSDRLGMKNPTVVNGGFSGKVLDIPGKMADFEAFGEVSKKLGVPLGKDSQGKLSMLDISAIKKAMQEQGYGAIRFSDRYANGTKAYAILPDNIKTKSQLKDIWEKANKK